MQQKGNIISRYRSTVAGGLLLTFALYFVNISLFSHYHVVDGVTIVHSHFHDDGHTKDPLDSTSHTKNELTLIHAISNFIVESPCAPFTFGIAYINICIENFETSESIAIVATFSRPPLRGPPVASTLI